MISGICFFQTVFQDPPAHHAFPNDGRRNRISQEMRQRNRSLATVSWGEDRSLLRDGQGG